MSKDIPFDELGIGDTFGPVDILADAQTVKRYCDEMKDRNPIYLKASPFGEPVVPPMFSAALLAQRVIGTRYDAHATVPTKLIQKNINPAKVGKRLILTGKLIDKYIKRGLEYAVIESSIVDEDGTEIRWVTDHLLLSLERRP